MELDSVVSTVYVDRGRVGRIVSMSDRHKGRRQLVNLIAVTHPYLLPINVFGIPIGFAPIVKQRIRGVVDLDRCLAVLVS
jgi:hypothetical protein